MRAKIQNYLSCSHFWWCTSFWQGIAANIDALFSLKVRLPSLPPFQVLSSLLMTSTWLCIIQSKRVLGNLVVLYLVAAIFFPVLTYFTGTRCSLDLFLVPGASGRPLMLWSQTTTGVWGLVKYYVMPLVVYHFWASSFLKTSSLLKLLSKIEKRCLTVLTRIFLPTPMRVS